MRLKKRLHHHLLMNCQTNFAKKNIYIYYQGAKYAAFRNSALCIVKC